MTPEIVSSFERQRIEIAKILLTADCIDLNFDEPHVFSSRIQSPVKVDCERLVQSEHFDKITSGLEDIIRSVFGDYRFFCGVIKGGALFIEELAKRFGVKGITRLGVKRDPERESMISGVINRNEKGIIVEDVLTTGENIALCAAQIEEEGGIHLGAVVIFDYGFRKAQDNIWKHHLRSWSLTTFKQLLTTGCELGKFTSKQEDILRTWWEETNQNLLIKAETATIVS